MRVHAGSRSPRRSRGLGWIKIGLGIWVAISAGCGKGTDTSASGLSPAASPPPSEAKKAFEQGKQAIFQKQHTQAIAAFTRAIQIAPQFQPAYVWRGVAYQEIRQQEKALHDFTKAIQLDPTDNYALEQRAHLYRRMGQPDKARTDEEQAAQLREKNRNQIRTNIEEAKKRKKRP